MAVMQSAILSWNDFQLWHSSVVNFYFLKQKVTMEAQPTLGVWRKYQSMSHNQ